MLLDIHLEGVGSEAHWQQKVRRELDLKLASVHGLLKRVRVELTGRPTVPRPEYSCRIVAVLHGGHVRSATLEGLEPHACLSATAARLRRSIDRAARSGELRHAAQKAG